MGASVGLYKEKTGKMRFWAIILRIWGSFSQSLHILGSLFFNFLLCFHSFWDQDPVHKFVRFTKWVLFCFWLLSLTYWIISAKLTEIVEQWCVVIRSFMKHCFLKAVTCLLFGERGVRFAFLINAVANNSLYVKYNLFQISIHNLS